MSALAFLASLGTGYLREDEKKAELEKADAREARQRQREDTADARATELYDAGKAERARVTADRDLIRNAAQPVPIAPEATMPATMDARDIGQPGEAPVPVTGYKVGAARFAERAAAEAESGRQTQARVATALDTVDPAGAQGRKTSALQGQAAELQVKAARDADAAKDWTRKAGAAIVQSGSWDEATRFMTESKADGLDGSTKWQHTVSPDGATVTVFPAGPDGKPQAKGFTVPNTDKGRLQLLMTLDQNTPASAKLADLRAEENAAATRENMVRDDKRADELFKLQRQRLQQVGSGGAGGQPAPQETPESTFDRKTAADIAKDVVKAEAEAAAGSTKPMSGVQMAKRQDEIVSAMYQQHANRFITNTVQRELTLARTDPAAYAQSYVKAARLVPPEALKRMGFEPPANPGAPGAAPPAIPSPPPRVTPRNVAAAGVPLGPDALRAAPADLTTQELMAVKPGHPAYQPAREELQRRAAAASAEVAGRQNFEPL